MPSTQIREIAAAQRLDNVRYAIRDLASVADEVTKQGHKVLALNVGDPNIFDFKTPAHLIEAVYKAMRENRNGYAPSPGIPEALEAIRGEAARKGISTVQDAFVTSGASEAVDVCLTALVNPGEHVLTPSPDYPLYSAVLCKLGIPVTPYNLNEDDAWQPDLIDMQRKINSRTRAIVLINPNNPTGAVCSRRMLEQLAELARRNNLVIFADEIYDKLILDSRRKAPDTYLDRGRRSRCAGRDFRWTVEKLPGAGLADWMGNRQRRRGRGETLRRRHSSPAAGTPVRQPSRTVRHQSPRWTGLRTIWWKSATSFARAATSPCNGAMRLRA